MESSDELPPTVSDARLASVLNTAVFGIIVIDETGRILVYNRACEQLFGWTAAEAAGRNVKLIMPPDYAREHDTYLRNYLETHVPKIIGIGREVRAQHKDGEVFPVQLAVGEAETQDGRQFIGILRDLRPEFEAAERLAELQSQLVRIARINAVDEMGATLAHELNQPLTALMLYLQAVSRAATRLTETEALPKGVSDILDKALAEADRAGKIIHRMRRFVEKREVEHQPADLAMLVEEAIEFTAIGSKAREVTIERRIAEGLPSVDVDPVQIQQIVVNLLRNAIDAVGGSDPKIIVVEIALRKGNVALSVEDSGPGIDPQIFPELFRAFATGAKGGVGLGLAISRSIAQSHGGDLYADPGGSGKGARFTLELPALGPPGKSVKD
ncbi:PAS domain S-box protein [Microbaculum marinum]|uniref:Sensor protein FixL n=1 Tax=Microbaculum marinum TaxID=1764581 RepID=A0AAW9RL35_9HYPH